MDDIAYEHLSICFSMYTCWVIVCTYNISISYCKGMYI